MTQPVIAILTDFGTADHYAGAMKGAILSVCRQAILVDITHGIPPHDVAAGALELAAAVPYFPEGTVFLAVVDPGVGSARRALAAEAGGFRFVGPDNGILAPALDQLPAGVVVSLDRPGFARQAISRTFEGRDRLGPAAAWLAAGTPLGDLGSPASDYVRLIVPEAAVRPGRILGEILLVDRFGNLVSNIRRGDLGTPGAGVPIVRVAGREIGPLVDTYAAVAPGTACALIGSTDRLEIAVCEGSAAVELGARRGEPVEVVWR